MDDDMVIYNNQTVHQGIKAIPKIFTSLYAEGKLKYEYRPIVKATFAIEYQLWGENPGISHFINILLFLATAILIYYLLKKFLNSYPRELPIFIVLLFIAHPIHTEVVSSLKNRDALLSFLGCLLAMNSFIRYVETKKVKHIIYGSLLFIFGYLSKSDSLTFLAVIPLVLYFFTDIKIKQLLWIGLILFAAMIIVRFGPKLYLPKPDRDLQFFENPLFFEKSRWIKMATGLYCLIFYIRILIFPHPLLFYYGYDMIPITNFANAWVLLSLIIHLGIFIYAMIKIKEKHMVSFAILYYLITISMFSNIVKPAVGIVAERFVYSASLGFCMVVAYSIFTLLKVDFQTKIITHSQKNKLAFAFLILLIPYSIKTIARNQDWKDFLTLYAHDIKYLDKSAKANTLYASTLLNEIHNNSNAPDTKAKLDLVINYYKAALNVYPKYATTWNNLGSVYFSFFQEYKKSIHCFRNAIQNKNDYVEAYFNLAYAYEKIDNADSAIYLYKKTIEIEPTYSYAYSNLGNLYFNLHDYNHAVFYNEQLMKVDPKTDLPYINMANYNIMRNDTIAAISYMEKAIEKIPNNYKVCMNLSRYYQLKGNIQKSSYYQNLANQATIPNDRQGQKK